MQLCVFYKRYPKCIFLGQNPKQKINDTVIRPMDAHDRKLTYSFVSPIFNESVIDCNKAILNALLMGFKKLAIVLEYSCENKNRPIV